MPRRGRLIAQRAAQPLRQRRRSRAGGRTQGVGVRFPADEKTRHLKLKIEEILGTQISSSRPTQTV